MTTSPPRALVIGGGVLGLSTAYHLARKKFGRITLLEKGSIGDGSSGRSAGIVTSLLLTRTAIRVRQLCLELFRRFSSELEGYEFKAVGCLNLSEPSSWSQRESLLPLYRELEAPFEVFDTTEMRARWPMLRPKTGTIGLFDPLGGYSEPHEYIPALATRVREMGVKILEQQMVTRISSVGGCVTGVKTCEGTIEADAVIGAVDSWTCRLLRDLGVMIPVKSFVHQRYVTEPLPIPLVFPATNVHSLKGYARPASKGRLLFGIISTDRLEHEVVSRSFQMSELSTSPRLKELIRQNFRSFIPTLKDLSWKGESVGLLTIPMDTEPILGPIKELPGLFVGLAFQGSGFAYNPAAGQLLAEFVADGHTSLDVNAFSPGRFDRAEAEAFLARKITEGELDMPVRRH